MIHRLARNELDLDEHNRLVMSDGTSFTGRVYTGHANLPDDEQEVLNGLVSGLGRAWHPNGELAEQRQYLTGLMHGLYQSWDKQGQIERLEFWELGLLLWRPDSPDAGIDNHQLTGRRAAFLHQQHHANRTGSPFPDRVFAREVRYDDGLYFHDKQPFTGWTYTGNPKQPDSESGYLDGLPWGLSRGWYRSGALADQSQWLDGGCHGLTQEWDEQGRLSMMECCELSIIWLRQCWDEHGTLIESYQLQPTERNFHLLEVQRTALQRHHRQQR